MTKEERIKILKDRYNIIKSRSDSPKYTTIRKLARQIRNLEKE